MHPEVDDARCAAPMSSLDRPGDDLMLAIDVGKPSSGLAPAAYSADALPCVAVADQDANMLELPDLTLPMDEHDARHSSIYDVDASDIRVLSALLSGKSAAPASPSQSGDSERQQSERKERRRLQLNERLTLKTEVQLLQQQLDALRARHNFPQDNRASEVWLDGAIVQRSKRRQAEKLNLQLRRALFQQGRFLRGFKSFMNVSEPLTLELNIQALLHTYSHLPEDRTSRARDLKTLCTGGKLDMAKRVVLGETESMLPTLNPNIVRKHLDLDDQSFGMTTVAVYAFDTLDASKVFQAAYDTALHSSCEWPDYAQIESSIDALEVPPMEQQVEYGAWRQVFQRHTTGLQVAVEGRNLVFGYMTDSYGSYLWDFVDADDLHPLQKGTTVTRGTTGAFVVRREVCPDGVERVVCRVACSDIHQAQQPELELDIDRFTETCNLEMYETIKGVAAR